MEQQNPLSTMIEDWQWKDPQVKALYAKGATSQLTLRKMLGEQMIEEKMRGMHSHEEIGPEFFHDWKKAFEIILALQKLAGTQPSPADEHLIQVLAMNMYADMHKREVATKAAIAVGIATVLFFTPWLLHKIGFGAKKK